MIRQKISPGVRQKNIQSYIIFFMQGYVKEPKCLMLIGQGYIMQLTGVLHVYEKLFL